MIGSVGVHEKEGDAISLSHNSVPRRQFHIRTESFPHSIPVHLNLTLNFNHLKVDRLFDTIKKET